MNAAVTPPATKTKTDAPKAIVPPEATGKAAKKEKAPADPNAPKKERAARKDLGITKDGVIGLTDKAREAKFRGKRAEYLKVLLAHEGKKVSEFSEAVKPLDTGKGGSGASWFRWFVAEGYATCTKPN